MYEYTSLLYCLIGFGNISINRQYHLIKYPQYNYCMHLALKYYCLGSIYRINYHTYRLVCVNSGPYIL